MLHADRGAHQPARRLIDRLHSLRYDPLTLTPTPAPTLILILIPTLTQVFLMSLFLMSFWGSKAGQEHTMEQHWP